MQTVRLGNLCTILTGKLDVNAHNPNGVYPFFTCAKENYAINTYAFDGESILIAGNGDLNAKYYVGKFNAYQRTYVLQNFVVNGKYLFWIITHNLDLLRLGARGSTIKYIRLGDLQNMEIPLYSLSQQQAIVDEIEKQFSRLDNGLQSLENIKTDLKSYKASVLKSSVEGKLTEQRRKENNNIEQASKLLEKILAERKHMREQDNPGKKYKEPHKVNIDGLTELPEGWCRASFDQVAIIESNLVSPKNYPNLIMIAPDNIEKFSGRLLGFGTVEESETISPKHYFQKHRIIYSKIRPNLSKLIIADFEGLCSADMYPINTEIDIHYLFNYMLSKNFLDYSTTSGSRTILPKINQKELSIIPVPLPPIKEQLQIVQELESKISITDVILTIIKANIKRAKQLKQSILHQAFTGKLIPMEDDDQGVTELLAEIERTKAMLAGQKKAKKTKKK